MLRRLVFRSKYEDLTPIQVEMATIELMVLFSQRLVTTARDTFVSVWATWLHDATEPRNNEGGHGGRRSQSNDFESAHICFWIFFQP